MKGFHHGEKGFTLIELLIVVAILGIIAAVVIPNVGGFMTSGTLNAANTEAENVKTAAVAYYAEQNPPNWPTDSNDLKGTYLTGEIKGTYTFDPNTGLISNADPGGWEGIKWDTATYKWIRTTAP